MADKEYIEREAVCYQLLKQATIDGQPRAIKRAAKIVADFPAADAIEELSKPRWISVEERLSEVDEPVMICAFGKSVGEGAADPEWVSDLVDGLPL